MNNHLHAALQSAHRACGSILDAEFADSMSFIARARLDAAKRAKARLMDALEHLTTYEYEIRESGTRPTGKPGATRPPAHEASGPVGRDSIEGGLS